MSDFAKNIRRQRTERGMSQEQFAEMLGVTRQTVSNWERAVSFPEMAVLESVADKLGVEPASLIYPVRVAAPINGVLYGVAAALLYGVLLFFGGLAAAPIIGASGMAESTGEAFTIWGLILLAGLIASRSRK